MRRKRGRREASQSIFHTCQPAVQVIEDWEAVEYERSTDALEAAIKAAVKDALSETRNAGRAAFRAYARARPDRVASLLDSVDAGLRQKLRECLQEGGSLNHRLPSGHRYKSIL